MSLKKTFIKNFISLFFSTIVARLFSFAAVVLIARYLGKHNFGIYSGAQAYAGIFALFFNMGMETAFVYKGSKDKSSMSWFLGSGMIFKLLLGVCFFLLMVFIARLLQYNITYQTFIIIIGLTTFLIQCQNFFAGVYQVYQRMEFKAIIDAGREILFLAILIMFIKAIPGIYVTASAELVANCIFLFLSFWLAVRFIAPSLREIKIGGVIKNSYLFALSGLFYTVYFQIDTMLLSLLRTPEETGIYAAAYKLPIVAFMITGIISTVTLPSMYESEVKDRGLLKKIYFLRSKYLAIIGLFIGVTFWFLRYQIVTIIFGSDFRNAGDVLAVLALFVPLRFVSVVCGDIITTMGRQNTRTLIQGVASVINIVLNLIIIPRYGIYGAAWATVASEVVLLGGYYFYASKLFLHLPAPDTFLKPLLASFGMIAICTLLKGHWILSYVLGVIAFCCILFASGTIIKKGRLIY